MNIQFPKTLRSSAAVLFFSTGIGISAPSFARPADPGWLPQLTAPATNPSACDVVLEHVSYGRSGYKVVGARSDCKERPTRDKVRWAGPRGTTPIVNR